MKNFYNIPFDKAKDFIAKLDSNKKDELCKKYQISESVISQNSKELLSVDEQLSDVVFDSDLYALGYVDNEYNNNNSSFECEYESNIDDIILFLQSLDDYDLEYIYNKYNTYNLYDIAVAITDYELENLGYGLNIEDKIEDTVDDTVDFVETFTYENPNLEYIDSLDFLDDINYYDIPYSIIDKDNFVFSVKSDVDYNKFKNCLDTNLVKYCEDIAKDDFGNTIFQVTPINIDETYSVKEKVVINSELNPALFNEDHTLKEDVKNQLLEYVNSFMDTIDIENMDIDVQDVALVGSNAGYLYTPESDIDIHIISDKPLDEVQFEELKDKFDLYEDTNPLLIDDTYKVELGIEDNYNIVMDNKDPRRYSLLTDEWINDSDKNEEYRQDDLVDVSGYEDIVKEYSDKIDDIVDNDYFSDAVELKDELRRNRSRDLAEVGALSYGNVVFKELRNNGKYEKLRNYILTKEEERFTK